MKIIALHGLQIDESAKTYLHQIIDRLNMEGAKVLYTHSFYQRNKRLLPAEIRIIEEASKDIDYLFSLGGDGTFLETILFVGSFETPVLGINMGRLGFLASISKEKIDESLSLLFEGNFEVEKRSLLELSIEDSVNERLFDGKSFAMNECAILRQDTSSMIKINSYINNQFLNTYWADGLMVATPTGSTGYSLSCGGPLMMPDSKDFVITPISPHNLNVRPLIISDDSVLKFEIESRSKNYLVSLDSRSNPVADQFGVTIKKANFNANTIKIEGINFPDTIRNKFGWGYDKRN